MWNRAGSRLHFDRAVVPGWTRFGSHPGSPMMRPATVSIAATRPSTSTAAAVQSGSPAITSRTEPRALRRRPAPRDPRVPGSNESPSSDVFDRDDRKDIAPSSSASVSARASVTETDAGDDGYLSDTTMSTIPPSYRTRRTTIFRAEKHPLCCGFPFPAGLLTAVGSKRPRPPLYFRLFPLTHYGASPTLARSLAHRWALGTISIAPASRPSDILAAQRSLSLIVRIPRTLR